MLGLILNIFIDNYKYVIWEKLIYNYRLLRSNRHFFVFFFYPFKDKKSLFHRHYLMTATVIFLET